MIRPREMDHTDTDLCSELLVRTSRAQAIAWPSRRASHAETVRPLSLLDEHRPSGRATLADASSCSISFSGEFCRTGRYVSLGSPNDGELQLTSGSFCSNLVLVERLYVLCPLSGFCQIASLYIAPLTASSQAPTSSVCPSLFRIIERSCPIQHRPADLSWSTLSTLAPQSSVSLMVD